MLASLFEMILTFIWNAVFARGSPRTKQKSEGAKVAEVPEESISLGKVVRSPFEAMSATEGEPDELQITAQMLLRHCAMLGGTGVGKTNLLLQVVKWLMSRKDTGVCLLDARGDLCDRVMKRLSKDYSLDELKDRLLVIDLRNDHYSCSLNILRESGLDPYTRTALLIDILSSQWEIGVATLQTLRACLLTIALTEEDYSLLEIEPLLVNQAFRKRLLASIKDTTLLRFWARFDALPDAQKSQWVEPVLNKINNSFLSRPVIRNLFASTTSLSLRKLLDERPDRIILCTLAFDSLYGDAALAGNIITTLLLSATMRTDRPEECRKPMYLVIDELENIASGCSKQLQEAIQEGRRFKLGLVLSNQSSFQLEQKLRLIIKNIVRTQIFYSVGGGEADLLAGEIGSDEPKAAIRQKLMSLAVGECLVVERGKSGYTKIRTRHFPDPEVDPAKVGELYLQAFRRFGRPRAEIEAEMAAREARYADTGVAPASEGKPPRRGRGSGAAPTSPEPAPDARGDDTSIVEVRDIDEDEPKPARKRRAKKPPSP